MAKNTIEVKLLGDNKDLARALKGSATDVESFGSKAGRAFRTGAIALGALGAGAAIAIPGLLTAGAGIEAVGIKSATVFGDSLTDVQSWASGVAGSMGLTNTELIGAAASFGDLLKPMGFTADEAANMSTEMLDLSGALSAWSGGQVDATGAADILAKAMLGEREGLKSLGISITEADVSARLAAKGQEDLTGAALEQAKALATQELILEKSTDAQTAWTDGSFDGIKAQNESAAAISEVKDAFVKGLYPALQQIVPVATKVAKWVGDNLPRAFEIAGDVADRVATAFRWVRDNSSQLMPVFIGLGAVAAVAFTAWAVGASAAAVATITAAAPVIALGVGIAALAAGLVWAYQNVDFFRTAVDKAWQLLKTGFTVAVDVATVAIDVLWAALQTAAGWVQTAWDKTDALRELAAGAFKRAVSDASAVIDVLWTAVKTAGEWIQTAWNKTDALRSLAAGGFKVAVEGARTVIDLLWAAVKTASSWVQTAWDKTENLRSLMVGGFKLAIEGGKTVVDTLWDAIKTAASWLQSAWTKSENLRSLMNAGFKTAVNNLRSAFDTARAAIKTLSEWVQTAWDKSDTLRSLFAGTFKTAVNGIKSAFNFARTAANNLAGAIQSVINKANTAISKISSIPGAGAIGGIIGGVFHDGGFVGSPSGPAKNIPIMAQQGEFVLSRAMIADILSGGGGSVVNGSGGGQATVNIHLMDKFTVAATMSQHDAELLAQLENGLRG